MATTFAPRTNTPRPPLPVEAYNVKLHDEAAMQPVKFQVITREGQEIVVGRIKVPTPKGHAFILRRFDTGAVSLSTMFRACYPDATDDAEKAETSWVKTNFDTTGSNGGGRLRLAGTWIPPALAVYLAERYNLLHILPALVEAQPEAKGSYRKSAKTTSSPATTAVGNENSHTVVQATVNGASPALAIPTSLPPTTPRSPRPSTRSAAKAASPVRQPPPKRSRKSASPAPSLLPKPTPTKAARSSPRRPAQVAEEEEEPEVPAPDPEQDIAEAKADVARLKAERDAALGEASVPATPLKKRAIQETETPPNKLNMEKIEESAMDVVPHRPVINRRRMGNLPPAQKAAAWGGFVFLLGLGASAVVPTLLQGGNFGLW